MLQPAADAPVPFPHSGSTAYTRGTGREVTIIQHNADATCTVKLHPPRFMGADERREWANRGASRTTRFALADLYPTEREAVFCGKPPKGRTARRPRVG